MTHPAFGGEKHTKTMHEEHTYIRWLSVVNMDSSSFDLARRIHVWHVAQAISLHIRPVNWAWLNTSARTRLPRRILHGAGCSSIERFLLCLEQWWQIGAQADTPVLLPGTRLPSHHRQSVVPLHIVDTNGHQHRDHPSRSGILGTCSPPPHPILQSHCAPRT